MVRTRLAYGKILYEPISGVAKTDVASFARISPAYKACRESVEFINEGRGGPSAEVLVCGYG